MHALDRKEGRVVIWLICWPGICRGLWAVAPQNQCTHIQAKYHPRQPAWSRWWCSLTDDPPATSQAQATGNQSTSKPVPDHLKRKSREKTGYVALQSKIPLLPQNPPPPHSTPEENAYPHPHPLHIVYPITLSVHVTLFVLHAVKCIWVQSGNCSTSRFCTKYQMPAGVHLPFPHTTAFLCH